jgi:hypothetical protein
MQPHKSINSQKERIHNRLNTLVGAGAAAFYRDACRLMEMETPLECTMRLVGHLLREIESSLRDVIKPLSQPKASSTQEPVKCPNCKHKFHIQEPKPSHKDEILAILNKFSISLESNIAELWLSLPRGKYALHKLTHRDSLVIPLPIDDGFKGFWQEIQAVFDAVLEKFEVFAAETRNRLDKLLVQTNPSSEDIKNLSSSIPNSSFALGYFFKNLKHPEWLKPLQEKGFFNHPPDIEIDAEGKTFRFYVWEQSRYLCRVASNKPEEVLEIGIQLFDRDYKNILIYQDLAEAALKMPPELAARWVERATQWLKAEQAPFSVHTRLPEIFGKLINYLASKNQVDVAINLARELLAILPLSSEPDNSLCSEPVIRFGEYYYSKIINENVLTAFNGQTDEVIAMLCDLLDKCLYLPPIINQDLITEDYSYVWHPNLDSDSGNQYNIKKLLTTTIWTVTKHLLELDSSQAKSLCKKFQSYRWRVFDRIAVHVMQNFPEQTQDLIVECLLDRERLNYNPKELAYSREHSKLLQMSFSNLNKTQKDQILLWLSEEPLNINEVEVQRSEVYVKYWRRDWLSVISDYLSPELSQIYTLLYEELSLMGNSNNVNPPKSKEEMVELAESDINELLNHFKECPKSHNNLSWAFVITPYAQKFVKEIERFKELDLQFMISLFRGLEEALKTQKTESPAFLWNPVFNFCTWIIDNLREIYNHESPNECNRLCDSMVILIDTGLQAKAPNQIPLILRNQVWRILAYLANDPHVTPSFTQSAYGASSDTVRGQAMHAIIRYAWWVGQDADCNVVTPQNLQDMPEVQQILEQHLDPQKDPSLAIRSVYGQWFLYLYQIAPDWTSQQIDQIFPKEPDCQELFDSAWQGYILRNQFSSDVFSVLREKYSHVIEQLPNQNSTSHEQSEASRALSRHLLNLFWFEVINLDEPDTLIERFFANASIHARGEFIRNIGWKLLYGTREPHNIEINHELRQRLQKFLDWRIAKAKELNFSIEDVSDLRYFSWWFASGKLDNQWAISKLIDVLGLLGTVDYCGDEFLEHLEKLAIEMPKDAVQCLSIMASGDKASEWFRSYRSEHYCSILQTALESGDETSQKQAEVLINQLVARNLADCRNLLIKNH